MAGETLRQELQQYLDAAYAGARIDAEHTVSGPVHIRYELGGENKNGTKKRVRQAADRALILFRDTFDNAEREIWMLAYEPAYPCGSSGYLRELFTPLQYAGFYDQAEQVNTRYIIKDEQGNDTLEIAEQRVIIGKLRVKDIDAKQILEGIARYEMGLTPSIGERIIFMDPVSHRAFLMYDDRGCYIWSNDADRIRPLYERYSEWIVEYHRAEIDGYFSV